MPEGTDLVVGGGRTAGGRCIIPVVRTFTLCMGGAAALSLTPVALLVVEGEREYLALLPGAPETIDELLETLRDDIDREKERCMGQAVTRGAAPGSGLSAPPSRPGRGRTPRS